MAEEDENEDAATCDPDDFTMMVAENRQRRDIWWLFHHELADKAKNIFMAAEALRDALGDVSKVDPDEEILRIRAILERKSIENHLEEFREHFQKMEGLLKSVRRMQESIFGDPLDSFVVPDPRITTVGQP
jgi:hypothetical protein